VTRAGILADTFAWIEILKKTDRGERAIALMEKNPPVFISVLTLYELQYLLEEQYGKDRTSALIGTILSHAEVIPVDNPIAIAGGSIKSGQKKKKSRMGAVDCMILATARIYNLNILTGDLHFKGCREAPDLI